MKFPLTLSIGGVYNKDLKKVVGCASFKNNKTTNDYLHLIVKIPSGELYEFHYDGIQYTCCDEILGISYVVLIENQVLLLTFVRMYKLATEGTLQPK